MNKNFYFSTYLLAIAVDSALGFGCSNSQVAARCFSFQLPDNIWC